MPATGTPEAGGLTWVQVNDLLKRLCQRRKVVSIERQAHHFIQKGRALVGSEAQIAGTELGYCAAGAQLRKGQRGNAAREDHEVQARRQILSSHRYSEFV